MEDHVYTLIQQTKIDSADIQRQSAIELGKVDITAHCQEAIRALCGLLGNKHIEVREAAEEALIKIGGRDVIEALIPHVSSTSTSVVNYVIEILSKIGDANIGKIVELLDSKDHDIRKFGCDILGNLQTSDCIYDLIELLNDPHINVAIAAGEALGKLGNPEAVPYLIQALQHPDTWMRCIAAEALGKIGDNRAVDAFIKMSVNEDPIVLYTVIKAMGSLQDTRVLPYIISILRSNPMFASSAVQAIENLAVRQGDEIYETLKATDVTSSFVRLLSSDNPEILRNAIHLVEKLRLKEAIQSLETLLHHEDDTIVKEAVSALVQIGEPELTVPVFEKRLAQTTNAELKNHFQQALLTLQKEQGAK